MAAPLRRTLVLPLAPLLLPLLLLLAAATAPRAAAHDCPKNCTLNPNAIASSVDVTYHHPINLTLLGIPDAATCKLECITRQPWSGYWQWWADGNHLQTKVCTCFPFCCRLNFGVRKPRVARHGVYCECPYVPYNLPLVPGPVVDAFDSGWYTDAGEHSSVNTNYFTGRLDPSSLYNNFFAFQLPTLTGTVRGAQLKVQTYEYSSPDPTETYVLSGVSTDIATLTAGGLGLTATYADLGDGPFFGTRDFSAADSNSDVSITLSEAAVAEINAKSGQSFAIGGSCTTCTTAISSAMQEYFFGFSELHAGKVQLLLFF